MATNPNDPDAYNRIRNGVQDLVIGGVFESLFKAVSKATAAIKKSQGAPATTAVQRRRPLETQSGREPPDIDPDPLAPRLREGTPVHARGAESGIHPWFRLARQDEPAVGMSIEDVSGTPPLPITDIAPGKVHVTGGSPAITFHQQLIPVHIIGTGTKGRVGLGDIARYWDADFVARYGRQGVPRRSPRWLRL